MTYILKVLPIALRDSNRIYRRLLRNSPQGAYHWYSALLAAVDGIKNDPFRFGLVPEQNLGLEVRQRLFKTRHGKYYRIVVTIADNKTIILRVRWPGQFPL